MSGRFTPSGGTRAARLPTIGMIHVAGFEEDAGPNAATVFGNIDLDIPEGFIIAIRMIDFYHGAAFSGVTSPMWSGISLARDKEDFSSQALRQSRDVIGLVSFDEHLLTSGATGGVMDKTITFPDPGIFHAGERLRTLAYSTGNRSASLPGYKVYYSFVPGTLQTVAGLLRR